MGRTAKLTISLPRELILFADKLAKEKKLSRSKVLTLCLKELERTYQEAKMEEGYKAMAQEQKKWAEISNGIAHEVIPEWK